MITKNKKQRITSQKKIILDYLKSNKNHPTAEMVYEEVKKKLPQISLGTVYRILNDFTDKKIIQKIPSDIAHFDGDTSSHAHFICEKCNIIFDVFNLCKDCKVLKKKKVKVGKIEKYQIYFHGKCQKCSKN